MQRNRRVEITPLVVIFQETLVEDICELVYDELSKYYQDVVPRIINKRVAEMHLRRTILLSQDYVLKVI